MHPSITSADHPLTEGEGIQYTKSTYQVDQNDCSQTQYKFVRTVNNSDVLTPHRQQKMFGPLG
jgi:hypothetical protein